MDTTGDFDDTNNYEEEEQQKQQQIDDKDEDNNEDDDLLNNQGIHDRLERLRDPETPFRLGTEVPNVKKDVSNINRSSTEDKKHFLKEVFDNNFLKTAGPHSESLFDGLHVTLDVKGKVSGATFDGEKILVRKGGKIGLSTAKRLAPAVQRFQNLKQQAQLEYINHTNPRQIEQVMEEQHGVVNPEVETIKSVQSGSLENFFESLDVKNYEIRQTMQRTQTKDNILTWHEAREINGFLRIDEQETSEDTVENIENHIKVLEETELPLYEEKLVDAIDKGDKERSSVLKVVVDWIKLKLDLLRVRINQPVNQVMALLHLTV